MKLLFEVILGGWIKHRRDIRRLVERYSTPIVYAADALSGRLGNLLTMAERQWLNSSDYYRLSTFYVLCLYFGWVEILMGGLMKLRMENSRRSRRLTRALVAVDKAFNNREYFLRGRYKREDRGTGELPKFICKGLGELVIREGQEGSQRCLGFAEFCSLADTDSTLKRWLGELNTFFETTTDDYGNATWDRLHLVELSLVGLVNLLDPKHLHSTSFSRKRAKAILKGINEPYARETFCVDIVRWALPIHIESTWNRMRRFFRIRLHRSPYLIPCKRAREYPYGGLNYCLEAKSFRPESPRGRWRMYQAIGNDLRKMTKELPFGVRINVVIDFQGEAIPKDVLTRLASNVVNASGNRTKEQWVQVRGLPCTESIGSHSDLPPSQS